MANSMTAGRDNRDERYVPTEHLLISECSG